MISGYEILAVLAAIIFATAIFDAVRRRLRHKRAVGQRLAEIGRPNGPAVIRSKDTGNTYYAPPGFGFQFGPGDGNFVEVTSRKFHPDWSGSANLFVRVRSARMNEVIRAADGIGYNDLVQSAIRLGYSEEMARAYATEILISEDGGEELPAAMAHSPNIGGEGQPKYRGPNYVGERDIVEELRGIVYFKGSRR